MRVHRGQPGVRLIGGVHPITIGEDTIMVTFYRPTPVVKMEFGAEFERHSLRVMRYARDVDRYARGWIDDAPLLEVTPDKIAPLLDFIMQHTADAGPFEDEVTGEVIAHDDLKPEHYRDTLYLAGYVQLVQAARAMMESDGMPREMRERLEAYLDIGVRGGCFCEACTGAKLEDKNCLVEPLRPLNDVEWALNQIDLRIGKDGALPLDAPGWLVQAHESWRNAQEKGREKAEFEAAQRDAAAKLIGSLH